MKANYFSITVFLLTIWFVDRVVRGLEVLPTDALLIFAAGAAIAGIVRAAWNHWRHA